MFGGTGTVASVARSLGRHFVHIDASPEYCELALQRIARVPAASAVGIAAPRSVTEADALSPAR